MDKGDISINTLAALFIGLFVLVVVIYLMFFYSKNPNINCSLCKANFADWCRQCAFDKDNWKKPDWVINIPKNGALKECIDKCLHKNEANTCHDLKTLCELYIFNTTATST